MNEASYNEQAITMGLVNKPIRIQQASEHPEQLFYGMRGRRYLRVHEDGRRTFYFPGMEYRIDNEGTGHTIVQIMAKGYSPDVQVRLESNGNHKYIYLIKDHLGSPVRTVDDAGAGHNPARFDPWGLRVEASGKKSNIAATKEAEKIRGYTGHEWIASAGLNHMNGRVHDPTDTGLFLGPDKHIQGRKVAALNRYTLGQNNNPNVVDPSGWTYAIIGYMPQDLQRMLVNPYVLNRRLLESPDIHAEYSFDDADQSLSRRVTSTSTGELLDEGTITAENVIDGWDDLMDNRLRQNRLLLDMDVENNHRDAILDPVIRTNEA